VHEITDFMDALNRLKNPWDEYRVRFHEAKVLIIDVSGRDILQGKVIDLFDNGTEKEAFLVVEVAGIEQPVIVPAGRILYLL
jgi:hypothetical protein